MTPSRTSSLAALAVAGLVAGGAALASAQDPAAPPTISISATKSSATVGGATDLVAGQTRISIKTPAHRTIALGLLLPGKTATDLKGAIAKSGESADPIFKVARLIGGGGSANGKPYVFTTALKAGTYEVVDDTQRPTIRGEFKVAAGANGAAVPKPAATIKLDDFHIASGTLPSSGAVSITNAGPSPHFIAVGRLKAGSSAAKVVAALRKGGKAEQAASKLLDPSTQGSLIDLISPGVTDTVETQALKPGKWLLACFYGDKRSHGKEHTMLGMETVVTVK